MTKHRYKYFMHCADCFNKDIKRAEKREKEQMLQVESQLIVVGPNQYKFLEKNGWVKDGKFINKFGVSLKR